MNGEFRESAPTRRLTGDWRALVAALLCLLGTVLAAQQREGWMVACGLFGLLAFGFVWTIPILEYDEAGIRVRTLVRRYARDGCSDPNKRGWWRWDWKDVEGVVAMPFTYWCFIVTKGGGRLSVGTMITKDYFRVLREVIELTKRANPDAKIDEVAMKQAMHPPRFRIF